MMMRLYLFYAAVPFHLEMSQYKILLVTTREINCVPKVP